MENRTCFKLDNAVFTRQTEPVASSTMFLPLFGVFYTVFFLLLARFRLEGIVTQQKKLQMLSATSGLHVFFFFRPSGCAVSKRLRNRCLRSIFTLKIIQVP